MGKTGKIRGGGGGGGGGGGVTIFQGDVTTRVPKN